MKHIRWIAVVGLIAIVELQYVWLVNTYKLTRENVMRQSHELFKDAALQEAFDRISLWKQLYGKKDSTYTYQFKLEADVVDSDTVQEEEIPETRQYIESAVFIAYRKGYRIRSRWMCPCIIWILFMLTCWIRLVSRPRCRLV